MTNGMQGGPSGEGHIYYKIPKVRFLRIIIKQALICPFPNSNSVITTMLMGLSPDLNTRHEIQSSTCSPPHHQTSLVDTRRRSNSCTLTGLQTNMFFANYHTVTASTDIHLAHFYLLNRKQGLYDVWVNVFHIFNLV